MKAFLSLVTVVLAVSLTMMFTACDDKGPAEKTGKKIDQAVEKTTDTLTDAGKKVAEGIKK